MLQGDSRATEVCPDLNFLSVHPLPCLFCHSSTLRGDLSSKIGPVKGTSGGQHQRWGFLGLLWEGIDQRGLSPS